MEKPTFSIEAFAETLGFRRWSYNPQGPYTYIVREPRATTGPQEDARRMHSFWNGGTRFIDWRKGEPLLGMLHSDLLFSEYDGVQQRNVLRPFPAPKTMEDAMEAAASIGWYARTV